MLLFRSILGDTAQALGSLTADVAKVLVGLGGRASQAGSGAGTSADGSLGITTAADVDLCGVGGLPVGGDGGLLGEGEVRLDLADLVGLGLGHFGGSCLSLKGR